MTHRLKTFRQGYAHVIQIRHDFLRGKRTKPKRSALELKWRTQDCLCADVTFALYDGHQYDLEHLGHRYGLYPNTIHWLYTLRDKVPYNLFKRACNLVRWQEQLLGRGMSLVEVAYIMTDIQRESYWAEHEWAANQGRLARLLDDVVKGESND